MVWKRCEHQDGLLDLVVFGRSLNGYPPGS
jgi:hypothetical protein